MTLLRHRTATTDGLNSIAPLFKIVKVARLPLYTFIYADVYSEKEVGIKVNFTEMKLYHNKKKIEKKKPRS